MDIKAIVSVNGKENVPGISVELERLSGPVTRLRAKFVNNTGEAVKLDHIRFTGFEFAGEGPDLRACHCSNYC
jgi:hypothetical protein